MTDLIAKLRVRHVSLLAQARTDRDRGLFVSANKNEARAEEVSRLLKLLSH